MNSAIIFSTSSSPVPPRSFFAFFSALMRVSVCNEVKGRSLKSTFWQFWRRFFLSPYPAKRFIEACGKRRRRIHLLLFVFPFLAHVFETPLAF
jgi:hypothetical protein